MIAHHLLPWPPLLVRRPRFAVRNVITVGAAVVGVGIAGVGVALAFTGPSVRSYRGCYLVGQQVHLTGAGFLPRSTYVVSIDDVYFGQSTTDARGGFSASVIPGGLGAGEVQHLFWLEASDGADVAGTAFTVSRPAGARFLARRGNPNRLRAPFEVWDFAPNGRLRTVYVHYVAPSGAPRKTVALGHTAGQCGYLRSHTRRLFPFSPTIGGWTLQVDTRRRYSHRPHGPMARIGVQIG
jgi:hypothetical protein